MDNRLSSEKQCAFAKCALGSAYVRGACSKQPTMKRRDDNRQKSKEEIDAEEDEESSAAPGTWQQAGSETLSGRKIVRARRPDTASNGAPAAAGPNVFASFNFASTA
eukprot:944-Heterococcus_DN1.PRE.1